ncbi:MAG: glycosyltransferase [Pseudodesulfovibrio sp.]|nr:glycosyltransferase [Pseudodesulfovibrio sp.]
MFRTEYGTTCRQKDVNNMGFSKKTEVTIRSKIIHTPNERCVAFFSDYLPRPDASSANLRVYEMISSLIEAGYIIHYHWWLPTKDDQRYLDLFAGGIEFHFIERNSDAIVRAVFKHRPGQVWFTNLWGTDWITSVFHAIQKIHKITPELQAIVDTMDYHAKKYYRKYTKTGDDGDLALANTFFEVESRAYKEADGIVSVGLSEARDIARAFNVNTPIFVISNIHKPAPSTTPFEERKDFVFLGNYRVPHNIDAIRWFLNNVYSNLQALLPDARLYLIGKHADELPVEILNHPAVTVVGFVKDLSPHMARHRAMVVPLPYGAGIKGKIGSAASCGLPVVTTSIGAEGYSFKDGLHAFVDDSPLGFAEKCARLHTEKRLWETMSANIFDHLFLSSPTNDTVNNLLRITESFDTGNPIPSSLAAGVYPCRSLPEFTQIMTGTDRINRVAIIEPTHSHQETFHSLVKQFGAVGLGVDFILRSELRDSRDILETLTDVKGIDVAFFYVLNPETVGDCISALNKANHRAIFFNTLFEYWLDDGLMDSPHWKNLTPTDRYAYVHHRSKFDCTTVNHPYIPRTNLFTLSEKASEIYDTPLLCPSFFYGASTGGNNDSDIIRFVSVGGVGDQRRDYNQIIDACILLNEAGLDAQYRVDIIGGDYTPSGDWRQKYETNIRRYGLESNIRLHGELPFKQLFSLVRKSDYLLFLINMNNTYSKEYLHDKITGSLNLSLGYNVVPILDNLLADNWGLQQCAVTYDGYHGFLQKIGDIVRGKTSKRKLLDALQAKNNRLMTKSINDLKKTLTQG